MSVSYNGLTACVTGAGGVIGAAVCRHLAYHGIKRILALDVDQGSLAEISRNLPSSTVYAHTIDLTSRQECGRLTDLVSQEMPVIQMLICLAGGSVEGDEGLPTPEIFRQSFERNVLVNVNVIQALLPQLKNGQAGIAMAGSVNATSAIGQVAYACAKRALEPLAANLTTLYGDDGIRANVVHLGTVVDLNRLNPRWRQRFIEDPDVFRKIAERYTRFREHDPLPTPIEAAKTLCFLASPDNTMISGQSIVADTGWTSHAGTYAKGRTGPWWSQK